MKEGAKPRDLEDRPFLANRIEADEAPFNPQVLHIVTDWMEEQERKSAG